MMQIETERLLLAIVQPAVLEYTAKQAVAQVEELLGQKLDPQWFEEAFVYEQRLQQWQADASFAPWSIRAIKLKKTGQIIGNINCHHKPMPFQMGEQIGLAVEMGYGIFQPHRRKGYALEAIQGFCGWAAAQHVAGVLLSIAPDNVASRGLARKLSAQILGQNHDPFNGSQVIFYLSTE